MLKKNSIRGNVDQLCKLVIVRLLHPEIYKLRKHFCRHKNANSLYRRQGNLIFSTHNSMRIFISLNCTSTVRIFLVRICLQILIAQPFRSWPETVLDLDLNFDFDPEAEIVQPKSSQNLNFQLKDLIQKVAKNSSYPNRTYSTWKFRVQVRFGSNSRLKNSGSGQIRVQVQVKTETEIWVQVDSDYLRGDIHLLQSSTSIKTKRRCRPTGKVQLDFRDY